MDSSTDEDSALSSEEGRLKTPDSFNSYSQHRKSSKFGKDFCFPEESNAIMPAFNNDDYYNFLNGKRRLEESSSEDDNDPQYDKMNEVNLPKLENTDNVKRSRLSNKEEITHHDVDKEKHAQEIQPAGNVYAEAQNNLISADLGIALQIMEKMGYQRGKGLGKHGQGLVEPIAAATQRGRRGFGHHVPELEKACLLWDPQKEVIKVEEDMDWLRSVQTEPDSYEIDSDWVMFAPKKDTIEGEVHFCNPEILEQILKSKTIFDKLDKNEMRKARTRSNPYETIRSAGFLNRAAVKMANIDKACDFMFTRPKVPNQNPHELLYFADVCAGPGGFSEYVLSRTKWHAKGFGFTLKEKNDFTLDEFFAGPSETFHPYYGPLDNGDVYELENQEGFRNLIMKHTQNKGVHFMMADGGFSVEGQENIQEILSKQLYLCQCLVALMVVRKGGHFVTKLFDLFTPFSAGLVYLMYRCFNSICIFKPNSSRPANSERYLICKNKRENTGAVIEYLMHINRLLSTGDGLNDVTQIVALDVLEGDKAFIEYLRNSNNTLGRKQIIGLLKIAAFCENPKLTEPKQGDMRKECLEYWEISSKTRVRPQMVRPQDKINEMMMNTRLDFLGSEAKKATNVESFKSIINSPYDWYCMPCTSGPFIEEDKIATLYLGLGKRKVFRYVRGQWHSVGDVKLELPENTLVYAELVYESKRMGKSFVKTRALHILDAYMLGGENVSKLYISNRYRLTKKFCEAIRKPIPNDYVCVRARDRFLVGGDINNRLQISPQYMRNPAFEFFRSYSERENEDDKGHSYIPFNSVLFMKSIVLPYGRFRSYRTKCFFIHNYTNGHGDYEVKNGDINRPAKAEASFEQGFRERIVWQWPCNNEEVNMERLTTMIQISLKKIADSMKKEDEKKEKLKQLKKLGKIA
ncbi:cap-specific mRNA (nucleoside-2'-O-)-methyltransferase 1 [Pseudomyrmex gracilis]|uniref:cap-specific mRNA (nucleoside-2'-O-)-methyltransferase 1 n=1 Tax=Pseudomyrmex gracilis TaxID=219809 RepID=UPI0009958C44|nr:cap-specific mRNA (nucleoside-2'-O-)-methyltransferase 1 [Pseudomyrmex gracilis]